MRALSILLAVGVLASTAEARPTADLVIVWAPGTDVTPVESVAREVGAAVIDRSPAPQAAPETARILKQGIAAYDALQLADASRLLDDALARADRTGGAGLTQLELSDLFLYRAQLKNQLGDPAAAWEELVTSVIIAPTRTLDPARFPPRVASEYERARASVAARVTVQLAVVAPAGCRVRVDGVATGAGATPQTVGPHWVDVTCTTHGPWGARVELSADTTLTARNAPLQPPSTDDMLIQARTAGASAFIVVDVKDRIATARLVGLDGKERDRRTATVTTTLAPLAPLVRELLVPRAVVRERWYQSKWAWAAGAALVATAIVVPVMVLTVGDTTPTSFGAEFQGTPATWGTR